MIDVIVTGGTGFIGKKLVKSLKKRGLSVLPLCSKKLEITSFTSWLNLPPAKYIYHLAGKSFVPNSWDPKNNIFGVNVLGTKNALAYCKIHKAKLCLASSYVYGTPDQLPINENHETRPNNPYALSKRISEQICQFSANYENISVTILRLFNVFGPNQNSQFLIPSIIDQIHKNEKIEVQDLNPRRDFVYLDDVVDAFISCFDKTDGFNIYNIGSGKSYSVKEVISLIQNLNNNRLQVFSLNKKRPNELNDVVADISRAKKCLNWNPKYTLLDGLKEILNKN